MKNIDIDKVDKVVKVVAGFGLIAGCYILVKSVLGLAEVNQNNMVK